MKITDNGGTANSGVDASATQTFTITVNPILPTVTTTEISNITNLSADGGGDVTDNGGASVTVRGICWSTSTNPTIALSTKTSNGTGNGIYTSSLSGLSAGVLYYVRAYATNSVGTSYGDNVTFQTLATQYVQTYDIVADPTFTTASISWSKGNMSSRVVFMKEGTGSISNPVNSTTYNANTNWTIKGSSAGSGYYCIYNGTGTAVHLTGLYPGRTYTIQAFEYNGSAGSENYLTSVSGVNNPSTVVPWPTTTFYNTNGVSSQEAWNNPTRWDHDTIPTAALHPAVLVYIDGNCVVTNAAESNNLTIYAAHSIISPKLTVNPAHSLNVIGPFANNGGTSALTVKASASFPNGTLTWGTGTITASVEMYSKASWDLTKEVNNKYSWQFFGIPVKQFSAGNTFNFSNCYVRKWDESVVDYYDVWVRMNDGTTLYENAGSTLYPGLGYELVQQYPTTYTFKGELIHENFTKTLSYSPSAIFAGQHVLGNPYTAAIDISTIDFGDNTEQAVYQYNTGTYQEWQNNNGQSSPGKARGQHVAASKNAAGKNSVPAQIPSMQGFLVKSVGSTGSITIPYVTALKTDTAMQRTKRLIGQPVSLSVSTRIDLTSENSSDRMWIFTDPSCTHKFDNGWDGRKILSASKTAQLFAAEEDGNYQIDGVNDMNETVLAFQPVADMQYKLAFNHENIESRYSSVLLMDLTENKTIDISANGSEYSFTATANSALSKRFKIITEARKSVDQSTDPSTIKIFNTKKILLIQNASSLVGEYQLYNMTGSVVQHATFNPNGISSFPTEMLIPGTYIVKASTDVEKAIEKIIIQ